MEGDKSAENEKEFTSISSSSIIIMEPSSNNDAENSEEKSDSNDTLPTSSTDANRSIHSTQQVSDDPISSTSSELEASSKQNKESSVVELLTLDAAEADKGSCSFDTDAELLGICISQSNEKIEENVEDLVNDLETLLGAPIPDNYLVTLVENKTEVTSDAEAIVNKDEKADNEVSSNTDTAVNNEDSKSEEIEDEPVEKEQILESLTEKVQISTSLTETEEISASLCEKVQIPTDLAETEQISETLAETEQISESLTETEGALQAANIEATTSKEETLIEEKSSELETESEIVEEAKKIQVEDVLNDSENKIVENDATSEILPENEPMDYKDSKISAESTKEIISDIKEDIDEEVLVINTLETTTDNEIESKMKVVDDIPESLKEVEEPSAIKEQEIVHSSESMDIYQEKEIDTETTNIEESIDTPIEPESVESLKNSIKELPKESHVILENNETTKNCMVQCEEEVCQNSQENKEIENEATDSIFQCEEDGHDIEECKETDMNMIETEEENSQVLEEITTTASELVADINNMDNGEIISKSIENIEDPLKENITVTFSEQAASAEPTQPTEIDATLKRTSCPTSPSNSLPIEQTDLSLDQFSNLNVNDEEINEKSLPTEIMDVQEKADGPQEIKEVMEILEVPEETAAEVEEITEIQPIIEEPTDFEELPVMETDNVEEVNEEEIVKEHLEESLAVPKIDVVEEEQQLSVIEEVDEEKIVKEQLEEVSIESKMDVVDEKHQISTIEEDNEEKLVKEHQEQVLAVAKVEAIEEEQHTTTIEEVAEEKIAKEHLVEVLAVPKMDMVEKDQQNNTIDEVDEEKMVKEHLEEEVPKIEAVDEEAHQISGKEETEDSNEAIPVLENVEALSEIKESLRDDAAEPALEETEIAQTPLRKSQTEDLETDVEIPLELDQIAQGPDNPVEVLPEIKELAAHIEEPKTADEIPPEVEKTEINSEVPMEISDKIESLPTEVLRKISETEADVDIFINKGEEYETPVDLSMDTKKSAIIMEIPIKETRKEVNAKEEEVVSQLNKPSFNEINKITEDGASDLVEAAEMENVAVEKALSTVMRRKTVEQDLEKIVCLSEESSDSDSQEMVLQLSQPIKLSAVRSFDDGSNLLEATDEIDQYTDQTSNEAVQLTVNNLPPPPIIDDSTSLETIMAVASLQSESIPMMVEERALSEKEIREMEAIRMAVASITDSSQDTYDGFMVDNNTIPMESALLQELPADLSIGYSEPVLLNEALNAPPQSIPTEILEGDTIISKSVNEAENSTTEILTAEIGEAADRERKVSPIPAIHIDDKEVVDAVEEKLVPTDTEEVVNCKEVIEEVKCSYTDPAVVSNSVAIDNNPELFPIKQNFPSPVEANLPPVVTEISAVSPIVNPIAVVVAAAAVEEENLKVASKVIVEDRIPKAKIRSKLTKVSEPLSINIEDVDKKEKIYSPKITIKPVKPPDEEVTTTSETETGKGSLKMTITKQSDTLHSILKVYNAEDDAENLSVHQEEPIPKFIIKPKIQQVEQQHSPKLSSRSKPYSPTTSRCSSPRITIKPVTECLSPLKITFKPVIKPDDLIKKHSPKEVEKNHNPKITIKPIPKPVEIEKEESVIPKVTIKAIKRHHEEGDGDVEQERSSPKIIIKPIVKPSSEHELLEITPKLKIKPIIKHDDEETSESSDKEIMDKSMELEEGVDEVKERIILKINKGNLPATTPKESKKREHVDEDKSEKVGIKLKFSTTGGHTHIVQDIVDDSNKRQRKDSGYSSSLVNKGSNNDEMPHKRALEDKIVEKNKRMRHSDSSPDRINNEDVAKIETTNNPVELSRSKENTQYNPSVANWHHHHQTTPDLSGKIADLAAQTTHISAASPILTVGVATPTTATAVSSPVPKKRGRPRKVPLQIREELKDPVPTTPPPPIETVSSPGANELTTSGGRPKRSCRGQNVMATLGIKPRKPRGRGRGSKVNMGDREPIISVLPIQQQQQPPPSPLMQLEEAEKSAEKVEKLSHHHQTPTINNYPGQHQEIIILDEESSTGFLNQQSSFSEPPHESLKRSAEDSAEEPSSSSSKRRKEDKSNKKLDISTKDKHNKTQRESTEVHEESSIDDVAGNSNSTIVISDDNSPSAESGDLAGGSHSSTVSGSRRYSDKSEQILNNLSRSEEIEFELEEDASIDEDDISSEDSEREKKRAKLKQKKLEAIEKCRAKRMEKLARAAEYKKKRKEQAQQQREARKAAEEAEKVVAENKGRATKRYGRYGVPKPQISLIDAPVQETAGTVKGDLFKKNPGKISHNKGVDFAEERSKKSVRSLATEDVVMLDEETRMSADFKGPKLQNISKQQSIIIPVPEVIVEDSQGSIGATEGGKSRSSNKAPKMEVYQDIESSIFAADQLAEYSWNGQGPFMLQEQVTQFLGIKSFKRKYPSITRRPVEMQERDYLKENGLVTETQCDLGLTAVMGQDILDIMYTDFQDKYEEYCKAQREKQAKDLANKQKALTLTLKPGSDKMDILEQAVQSAATWNQKLNKAKREQRRAYMDLQSLTIHYPKSRMKVIPTPKIGNYPIALVPGQFTDYFNEYTPTELNNLPVNTMLYKEIKIPSVAKSESDDSSSGSESDSESASGTSNSDSSCDEDNCNECGDDDDESKFKKEITHHSAATSLVENDASSSDSVVLVSMSSSASITA